MADYFETQTASEVNEIDFKRITQDNIELQSQLQEQIITDISDKIDNIETNVNSNVDLSEVTDLLADIDTNTISAQNQDIIEIVQEQQSQINSIENKLDMILKKLE
jgi:uncharacterized coiled-coil protein SlyX